MNQEIYNKITFRLLAPTDILQLWNWLQQPHIAQWYNAGKTFEEVQAKFQAYINKTKPTHAYIVLFDGTEIGYIQCYRIDDYSDYKKVIAVTDNACGIDMFIGDRNYLHRGIGPLMIIKFLDTLAFPLTNTDHCYLGPDPKNEAAKKAYGKVGFSYIKTVRNDGKDEYIMQVTKAAISTKANALMEKSLCI